MNTKFKITRPVEETRNNIKELSLNEMFEIRGGGSKVPNNPGDWD